MFDDKGNCHSSDLAAVRKKYIFLRTGTRIANEKLVRNVCVNADVQLARGRGGRRRENQLVRPTPELSVSLLSLKLPGVSFAL